MSWNVKYSILLFSVTLITYISGWLIGKFEAARKKRIVLFTCIGMTLFLLCYFKYSIFLLDNLRRISHINFPALNILLPVGISFYVFQAISYVVDVYRGHLGPEKNYFTYALFLSFFPQLVAGPIERSTNLLAQFKEEHRFEYDSVRKGLLLMLWGLFQKIVIADRAAILVNSVFDNYTSYPGICRLIAAMLFAVEIYCDFSGYSNMAIGAAKIMGFTLINNFDSPYSSESIKEFWRRWHISLSNWFRDYVYIPLGGNRCSRVKKYRNLMVTFLLSGLWHGAGWNYLLWGVYTDSTKLLMIC